ncbi:hypothetical protein [Sphingomonas sp.]
MTFAHPLRIVGWAIAAALLLAPLVAMRFTDQVVWGAGDFAAVAQLACSAVSGIAGLFVPAIGTFGFAALWLVAAKLFARADQRSRIP